MPHRALSRPCAALAAGAAHGRRRGLAGLRMGGPPVDGEPAAGSFPVTSAAVALAPLGLGSGVRGRASCRRSTRTPVSGRARPCRPPRRSAAGPAHSSRRRRPATCSATTSGTGSPAKGTTTGPATCRPGHGGQGPGGRRRRGRDPHLRHDIRPDPRTGQRDARRQQPPRRPAGDALPPGTRRRAAGGESGTRRRRCQDARRIGGPEIESDAPVTSVRMSTLDSLLATRRQGSRRLLRPGVAGAREPGRALLDLCSQRFGRARRSSRPDGLFGYRRATSVSLRQS